MSAVLLECSLSGGFACPVGPLEWTMGDRWLEGQIRAVAPDTAKELCAMYPESFHRMMTEPPNAPVVPAGLLNASASHLASDIRAGNLDALLGPLSMAERSGRARAMVLAAIRDRTAQLAG